jgi:DNA-binding NarL/FixJ family response regulator
MRITVSIVEDNPGMREGFTALLNRAPNLKCVSAYGTAEDAVRCLPVDKPDVALVDVHLPGMDGVECVGKLKELMPGLRILMLTRYEQSDVIFSSIRAGASGYLLKSVPPAELILAVELVHAGGAPMSMQIAHRIVNHFRTIDKPASDVERLTPREQELLELLAKGYSYKELSDKLGITINTVRTHLQHIYEKLHVQSRTQAVLKFLGR